jgi:hypothetical protein
MPGTWFEALIVASLAILLWRPRARWRAVGRSRPVLGTSAAFAQVGEALILPGDHCWPRAAAGGGRSAGPPRSVPPRCRSRPTARVLRGGRGLLLVPPRVTLLHRRAAACGLPRSGSPAAEAGDVPHPGPAGPGAGLAGYQPGSPIRPYYANLPRAETDSRSPTSTPGC